MSPVKLILYLQILYKRTSQLIHVKLNISNLLTVTKSKTCKLQSFPKRSATFIKYFEIGFYLNRLC